MLRITRNIFIPENEIEMTAVRAQGAGGQNVNKVATAIHLRFDIPSSSLPDFCKCRLLRRSDQRITKDGVLIIKAQTYRTQEKNRADALQRLQNIISTCLIVPKKRRPTRPTKKSQKQRMDHKRKRGRLKKMRGSVGCDE